MKQHKLNDTLHDSASNTNQMTQDFESKQIIDVASQTSPPKGFQLQSSGTATEQFREKSGNEQVMFLESSNRCPSNIRDSRKHIMTTLDGESSKSPLTSTTPHIEEKLVRDEQTTQLYSQLTSKVGPKCKQEMLYAPLCFNNNQTKDALVDSGAYVSAIAQNELNAIKQKAPSNIFKIIDSPNFQTQVANSQFDKPLATATL